MGALRKRAETLVAVLGLRERRCASCLEPFDAEESFRAEAPGWEDVLRRMVCPRCRKSLKRRELGFCPYCGEPSAVEEAPCMPCVQCTEMLPPWHEFLFFGVYEGLLRDLLLRAKFGRRMSILDMLGQLLAAVCAEHYALAPVPDVVVPVPLDRVALHSRGFNQCRELAMRVSRVLHIPVRTDLLMKPKQVIPQESRSRNERDHLDQPFASRSAQGLRVLLVDDVCTTGATLRRATECLLEAGAAEVDVAVVARASLYERFLRSDVFLP